MYNQKPLLGTLPNYAHPLTPNVGAWLFNENSGNTVFDTVGGNHGTIHGATWLSDGLDFNGNSDYIEIDKRISDKEGTIEAWVSAKSASDEMMIFWGGDLTGNGYGAEQEIHLSNDNPPDNDKWGIFCYGTTAAFVFSPVPFSLNRYDQVIGTYRITGSDINVELFINGVRIGTDSGTGFLSNNFDDKIRIGRPGTSERYLNGSLKSVCYWDYVLNPSKIAQLYTDPYCWLAQPMGAELMYAAPPVGVIMNQFQRANLGADLYDGVLIT